MKIQTIPLPSPTETVSNALINDTTTSISSKKPKNKKPTKKRSIFLQNLLRDISLKAVLEKDNTGKTLLERSINATSRTKPEAILNFASKLLPKDLEQQETPKFAPILINISATGATPPPHSTNISQTNTPITTIDV